MNRGQSYVAKIELSQRGVEVRAFLWIIQQTGSDPLPLLSQMLLYSNFRDLQRRPKRVVPHRINGYDQQDDNPDPDDDENVLGHLKFASGGAV